MLDKSTARQLKKEMDAAYIVFKKSPTTSNAALWSTATRSYNDFCISYVTELLETEANKQEEILNNIEQYRDCEQCKTTLLYPNSETEPTSFVASGDFLEDFPGWCYNCLSSYCTITDCSKCTVTTDQANCSFAEVKKFLTREQGV